MFAPRSPSVMRTACRPIRVSGRTPPSLPTALRNRQKRPRKYNIAIEHREPARGPADHDEQAMIATRLLDLRIATGPDYW